MLQEFLMVGIGGFFGSLARFALTKWLALSPSPFPLGTLLSNILAGLFIGLIIGFDTQTQRLDPKIKLLLTTGLLGGLSTFSTFSLETVSFLTNGKYLLAAGNVSLNLGLSLLGVLAGFFFAKMFFAKS